MPKELVPNEQQHPDLWPRFRKVRESIIEALSDPKPRLISREVSLHNWGGFDAGITDVNGTIRGETDNGLGLELNINGSLVSHQQNVELIDGRLTTSSTKKSTGTINGNFFCPDGFYGQVEVHLNNGESPIEAFWLNTNDRLQLDQVVVEGERVVETGDLETNVRGEIKIPNTSTRLRLEKYRDFRY